VIGCESASRTGMRLSIAAKRVPAPKNRNNHKQKYN
jgi:hypothetical protein